MTIWSCRKNGLIRESDKVIFKIYDVTTWLTSSYNMYMLIISRSKGNEGIKFGQLIEYKKYFFYQKSRTKLARETSSKPLFVFLKASYEIKANGLQPSNFRQLIQRCVQFLFFRKGPGFNFPTTFCVWFFKKNVSYFMFY